MPLASGIDSLDVGSITPPKKTNISIYPLKNDAWNLEEWCLELGRLPVFGGTFVHFRGGTSHKAEVQAARRALALEAVIGAGCSTDATYGGNGFGTT